MRGENRDDNQIERNTAVNIQHLIYAVEVEKMHSISKAAESLYMGQPNLSRAIKELEESIGITLFNRTPHGVTSTTEGAEFLKYAKSIVDQVTEIESIYSGERKEKATFTISVPRASYIAQTFTDFVKNVDVSQSFEFNYKETNAMRTIKNVDDGSFSLGIIRFQQNFEAYFTAMMEEKSMSHRELGSFSYLVLMSERHPLAQKERIVLDDLSKYIELSHGDPYVPYLPFSDVKKAEDDAQLDKRIYVYERGSQFDLLSEVCSTFMWVSPIPDVMLKRHGLVQRKCEDATRVYKEILNFKEKHKFTELENEFLDELKKCRKEVFSEVN